MTMGDTRKALEKQGFEASLHKRWYLDPEYFEREKEAIFTRDWFCVGRESSWSGPGDHRVLSLFGESVLVLRNRAGELRAFYNVCRHRGARLCAEESRACDSGQAATNADQKGTPGASSALAHGGVVGGKLIRCPYHAWTYDLDGQLIHAPFLADQAGFDPEQISLHPVGLACWGGFVFLNLSPETAPPFEDLIATANQRLARYPLDQLRTGHRTDYSVRANWKVLCENYNECYHCGPVHPELSALVPSFREHGGSDLDWERGIPHRQGATTFTASGETTRRSFPGLNQDEQERHKGELLLPNLFLSLSRDHVAAFILLPTAADRCEVQCLFLFEPFEMQKADFDPHDAADFWDLVNRQDWAICESVQQGMGARVFDYGALSPLEDWSLDVRRYVKARTGLGQSGQ